MRYISKGCTTEYIDKIRDLKATSISRLLEFTDKYADDHDKYYDYLEKTFKNF